MRTEEKGKLSLAMFHIMCETDVLNGYREDYECPYDNDLFSDEDQEDLRHCEKCLLYSKEVYTIEEGRSCNIRILIKKETCGSCGKKENPKSFVDFEGTLYCEQCQEEYISTCCREQCLEDSSCLFVREAQEKRGIKNE